jgi:hypothetical protein
VKMVRKFADIYTVCLKMTSQYLWVTVSHFRLGQGWVRV